MKKIYLRTLAFFIMPISVAVGVNTSVIITILAMLGGCFLFKYTFKMKDSKPPKRLGKALIISIIVLPAVYTVYTVCRFITVNTSSDYILGLCISTIFAAHVPPVNLFIWYIDEKSTKKKKLKAKSISGNNYATNEHCCVCKKEKKDDEFLTVNDKLYCKKCYNKFQQRLKKQCKNCGKMFEQHEIIFFNGKYYCKACINGIIRNSKSVSTATAIPVEKMPISNEPQSMGNPDFSKELLAPVNYTDDKKRSILFVLSDNEKWLALFSDLNICYDFFGGQNIHIEKTTVLEKYYEIKDNATFSGIIIDPCKADKKITIDEIKRGTHTT